MSVKLRLLCFLCAFGLLVVTPLESAKTFPSVADTVWAGTVDCKFKDWAIKDQVIVDVYFVFHADGTYEELDPFNLLDPPIVLGTWSQVKGKVIVTPDPTLMADLELGIEDLYEEETGQVGDFVYKKWTIKFKFGKNGELKYKESFKGKVFSERNASVTQKYKGIVTQS